MRDAGARYELTFPAVLTRVRCQRRSLLSLPLPEETETRGGRTPNSKFNVSGVIVNCLHVCVVGEFELWLKQAAWGQPEGRGCAFEMRKQPRSLT